ncbi:MAG: beta-galactosidase [Terracidiphilus sp.]|nr:beta-galactosidase [Terracidiphilus sp.]
MKHCTVAALAALVCLGLRADAQQTFRIDATAAAPAVETGFLAMGGTSPSGHSIGVDSRSLTLDGKPWLPVMGEFHYARYPEQYWQEELEKMKAGGVQVVAAYVFWIHHEEIEGQFDWTGRRDLRRFVGLCAQTGLKVVLRVGPWDHGEARNGGFPDWLIAKKIPLRRNDPEYLRYVGRLYGEIGKQIAGELWQQGGPIVAVQLENEYGEHGPGAGGEHLAELKRIAVAAGIAPPLFTVTAWPENSFPPREFIPVFGGYADDFWSSELTDHGPNHVYLFATDRAVGDMGAMARDAETGKRDLRHYPYATAEQGGGMETSYHRRPLMDADDIAAETLTAIGSGANLYGYYMFHGGANPDGKRTTLQESTATNYPNDLPVISYDFQAPLGQYGQQRASFRKTKTLHLFVEAVGPELATMASYAPDRRPRDAADLSMPRMIFRAAGNRGFLFVNNYVRKASMPARPGFQVRVKLPAGMVEVPREPVDIPANSYFIWPVNLNLGAGTLVYSTAQLLTRIEIGGEQTWFFSAVPGIASEFVFDRRDIASTGSSFASTRLAGNDLRVGGLKPGRDSSFQVEGRNGQHVRIVLLTAREAEDLWMLRTDGKSTLLISAAGAFAGPDGVHLRSTSVSGLEASVFAPAGSGRTLRLWQNRQWTVEPAKIRFQWTKLQDAAPRAALHVERVQGRKELQAIAPSDADFASAARWTLTMPAQPIKGISDLWLRIHYTGDVARFSLGSRLLDDDFYNGRVWEIGLKRYLPSAFGQQLEVGILPLPASAPVYLDRRARTGNTALAAQVTGIEVVPEYEIVFQPDRAQ